MMFNDWMLTYKYIVLMKEFQMFYFAFIKNYYTIRK